MKLDAIVTMMMSASGNGIVWLAPDQRARCGLLYMIKKDLLPYSHSLVGL